MSINSRFAIWLMMACLCNAASAQFHEIDRDILYKRIVGAGKSISQSKDTLIPVENILDKMDFAIFENRNDKNRVNNYLKVRPKNSSDYLFLIAFVFACIVVFMKVSSRKEMVDLFKSTIQIGGNAKIDFSLVQLFLLLNYFFVLVIFMINCLHFLKPTWIFNDTNLMMYVFVFIVLAYVSKLFVWMLLDWIFDLNNLFYATMKVNNQINIFTGIALLPIILLEIYSHSFIASILIYTASLIILINILYKGFKNILMHKRYIVYHLFQFIIYICAVEIIPLLLLNNFLKAKKFF